jgi:hypothetical protein
MTTGVPAAGVVVGATVVDGADVVVGVVVGVIVTVTAGAVTVTAGAVTVTAGAVTVTAGAVTVTAGAVTVTGGAVTVVVQPLRANPTIITTAKNMNKNLCTVSLLLIIFLLRCAAIFLVFYLHSRYHPL